MFMQIDLIIIHSLKETFLCHHYLLNVDYIFVVASNSRFLYADERALHALVLCDHAAVMVHA